MTSPTPSSPNTTTTNHTADDKDGTSLTVTVHPLERHEFSEAAHVMAQAFCDSPSYAYMFESVPNRTKRIAALQWLFTQNLKLLADSGVVAHKICVHHHQDEDGSTTAGSPTNEPIMVGTVLCTPVTQTELTVWTMLYYGLYQIPFRFGWRPMKRLLATIDEFQAVWNSMDTTTTTGIQLERMTIRPDYQGRGIGSRALRHVLSSSSSSLSVRLATQEERNVQFYQRLGFRVVHHQTMGHDNGSSYPSWFMVRDDPQPTKQQDENNNQGNHNAETPNN